MDDPADTDTDPVAFAEALRGADPPLDRALAELAAFGRPGVDASRIVARLDELAGACRGTTASALCASLFGELGFRGDTERYHDPRNSLLDQVLDRRLGMPITLSAVAVEVGRRRGVGLVGVGMPGHFLLRDAGDPDRFLDAFDGGRVLDRDGCAALHRRLHGPATPFDDTALAPTPVVGIAARVLNNLGASYAREGDRHGVLRVERLRAVVPGAGLASARRLATALAAAGRFDEAARRHDVLAGIDVDAADEHRAAARRLRAAMN
jgi:regulator of sirC expression with transglutaminase-like and TPR domain